MLNTDQIEGIIPLRNRIGRVLEHQDEERTVLRNRFRESELEKNQLMFEVGKLGRRLHFFNCF